MNWHTAVSVGRLHIVGIAAMGVLTFGWALSGRYLWLAVATAALDWFLVNILNRVVDLPEDRINSIRGTGFVENHRRTILIGGFALLAVSLLGVHLLAPSLTPWRAGYHLLGLSYNWRLLPGGVRIKNLYGAKNLASGVGFLLTCFGYPLALVGYGAGLLPDVTALTVLLSIAFFLPFELSYEVIYDLRDVEGDRMAGVRTFPAVHGIGASIRIIDGLLLVSSVVAVTTFALGLLPWRIAVMASGALVQVLLYKRWLGRGITSADCIRLTWLGAALLVAYNLWVLAELPGV